MVAPPNTRRRRNPKTVRERKSLEHRAGPPRARHIASGASASVSLRSRSQASGTVAVPLLCSSSTHQVFVPIVARKTEDPNNLHRELSVADGFRRIVVNEWSYAIPNSHNFDHLVEVRPVFPCDCKR